MDQGERDVNVGSSGIQAMELELGAVIVETASDGIAVASLGATNSIGGNDGGGHTRGVVAGDQKRGLGQRGNLEVTLTSR